MFRLLQISFFLIVIAGCATPHEPTDVLRTHIEQIISERDAIVGVSIIANGGADSVSIHGDRRFPMQSVFKFHIALVVLAEVDKGVISLDQEVLIQEHELLPDLWSPLREENPEGGYFTVARLIQYSVSRSDNVACDVLIRLIGTPKTVEAYFKQLMIDDIAIVFNEEHMQADWDNMFENWTTPDAASKALTMFYTNDGLLSDSSYAFIWKTMKETTTGANQLRGQLPAETVVAHKTGRSEVHEQTGIRGALNDIGIVFLPDGNYFVISVFITESKEDLATNEKIISDISKAVYDYYTADSK